MSSDNPIVYTTDSWATGGVQEATIESFLLVSQLACYWRPAALPSDSHQPQGAEASVDPRGPNAILRPLDCSLRVAMVAASSPSAPAVAQASAVVDSVDIGLHHMQVCSYVYLSISSVDLLDYLLTISTPLTRLDRWPL